MKKQSTLRSIALLSISIFSTICLNAQGNNWRIDGNSNIDNNSFIGTTTNQPFKIKTDNQLRLKINPNGAFIFNDFSGVNSGLFYSDLNGKLTSIPFTANSNQVLLGNGTFGTLPSSSYFTLNIVNQLYTPYKLGIGVLLPTEMLEVNGNGIFNGTVTTQEIIISDVAMAKDRLLFRNSGMLMEGYNPTDGTRNEIASISQPLYLNSMSSFNQNTIINSGNLGNVGIGTNSPSEKLEVVGNVKFTNGSINFSSLVADTNSNDEVVVIDSLGNLKKGGSLKSLVYAEAYDPYECQDKFGGPKQFPNPTWSNGLNKIYVRCPQVFVGIGTASPRVNLDVRGTSYSNRIAIGDLNPVNIGAYLHIKTDNSITSPIQIPILVENQGQKILQLNKDGLLYAREIKVNLDASWPDYVFEPTYKLRPLSEVKQFILENKHLPNVPSAKEIEENGLNLGEGNKILLEKVEEMTLYMIQMEENLKKQEELLKVQSELLKAQQEQILLLQTQNK